LPCLKEDDIFTQFNLGSPPILEDVINSATSTWESKLLCDQIILGFIDVIAGKMQQAANKTGPRRKCNRCSGIAVVISLKQGGEQVFLDF